MSEPTEQQHTEEHDPQFEPVIRLTEQVEAKTGEEDDEVLFKMFVLLSVCRADH
jgi:Ran-binding protein 1